MKNILTPGICHALSFVIPKSKAVPGMTVRAMTKLGVVDGHRLAIEVEADGIGIISRGQHG